MKSYLVVTGVTFALLVVAHISRIAVEGWHVTKDPAFLASTLLSLALFTWAVVLYRRQARTERVHEEAR